jgi:hypothetical protein
MKKGRKPGFKVSSETIRKMAEGRKRTKEKKGPTPYLRKEEIKPQAERDYDQYCGVTFGIEFRRSKQPRLQEERCLRWSR